MTVCGVPGGMSRTVSPGTGRSGSGRRGRQDRGSATRTASLAAGRLGGSARPADGDVVHHPGPGGIGHRSAAGAPQRSRSPGSGSTRGQDCAIQPDRAGPFVVVGRAALDPGWLESALTSRPTAAPGDGGHAGLLRVVVDLAGDDTAVRPPTPAGRSGPDRRCARRGTARCPVGHRLGAELGPARDGLPAVAAGSAKQ